ncbi:hypothetical protein PPSIR1_03198 [Plesiocystis pacifica SIR-1]|uniref:Uncharacterized protein n=1 Tax=Plesiocystis pacifica SIR-1 TaxID=391625 RepID=A6GJE5_9BACT|nr:hypothetical protein [Plesiocystis pacifica]EDM74008.1 hypothetical protein PPSIR1_03198 [Plesiocystis pacifica SIR-1]
MLGVFLSTLSSLSPLAPEPAVLDVDWAVADTCPSRAEFEGRVQAYLGRPLAEADARWPVDARVVEARGAFALALEVGGQRHRLRHHDCRQLAELAASLVAVVIDPLADPGVGFELPPPPPRASPPTEAAPPVQRPVTVQRPRSAPTPEPAAEPWAPPRRAASPGPFDLPRRRARRAPVDWDPPSLVLALASGASLGTFPNVGPVVDARVGLDLRDSDRPLVGARVLAVGGVALAGRFRDDSGARGADLIAWELGLSPCWVAHWGRPSARGQLDLRTCAALSAGQLRAQPVATTSGASVVPQPWVRGELSLGLAVALSRRVGLFADLSAGANLLRPRFVLADPSASYVVPAGTARALGGIELRFLGLSSQPEKKSRPQ